MATKRVNGTSGLSEKMEKKVEKEEISNNFVNQIDRDTSKNPSRFKSVICQKYSQGKCRKGDACKFSHGDPLKKIEKASGETNTEIAAAATVMPASTSNENQEPVIVLPDENGYYPKGYNPFTQIHRETLQQYIQLEERQMAMGDVLLVTGPLINGIAMQMPLVLGMRTPITYYQLSRFEDDFDYGSPQTPLFVPCVLIYPPFYSVQNVEIVEENSANYAEIDPREYVRAHPFQYDVAKAQDFKPRSSPLGQRQAQPLDLNLDRTMKNGKASGERPGAGATKPSSFSNKVANLHVSDAEHNWPSLKRSVKAVGTSGKTTSSSSTSKKTIKSKPK